MRSLLVLLCSLLFTGCTTIDQSRFSPAARLMIGTKLATASEMQKMAKQPALNKEKAEEAGSTNTAGLVIGSGLAGSTAFYASTGAWLSPKAFMDVPILGIAAVNTVIGRGMKHHKWTYTYFFYMSGSCDDRKCINQGFERFHQRLVEAYKEEATRQGLPLQNLSARFSGAGRVLNGIDGYMTVTIGGDEWKNLPVFGIADVDRIGEHDGMHVWGNDSPYDFQDRVQFPKVTEAQISQLLIEASKADPAIYIFRGVDLLALSKKQPCSGGYFINNGKKLVASELGCEPLANSTN